MPQFRATLKTATHLHTLGLLPAAAQQTVWRDTRAAPDEPRWHLDRSCPVAVWRPGCPAGLLPEPKPVTDLVAWWSTGSDELCEACAGTSISAVLALGVTTARQAKALRVLADVLTSPLLTSPPPAGLRSGVGKAGRLRARAGRLRARLAGRSTPRPVTIDQYAHAYLLVHVPGLFTTQIGGFAHDTVTAASARAGAALAAFDDAGGLTRLRRDALHLIGRERDRQTVTHPAPTPPPVTDAPAGQAAVWLNDYASLTPDFPRLGPGPNVRSVCLLFADAAGLAHADAAVRRTVPQLRVTEAGNALLIRIPARVWDYLHTSLGMSGSVLVADNGYTIEELEAALTVLGPGLAVADAVEATRIALAS